MMQCFTRNAPAPYVVARHRAVGRVRLAACSLQAQRHKAGGVGSKAHQYPANAGTVVRRMSLRCPERLFQRDLRSP